VDDWIKMVGVATVVGFVVVVHVVVVVVHMVVVVAHNMAIVVSSRK